MGFENRDHSKDGSIRYEWDKIKYDYVTNSKMSLTKLSEKYGVSYNTLSIRCRKEGWYKEKKEHQRRVVSKAIAKAGTLQARELADELEYLNLMKGHMKKLLKDQLQFNRHLVPETVSGDDGLSITTTVEKTYEKMDSRAMREAMQTITMIESLDRSLLGILRTENLLKHQQEEMKLKMERERLELEKEKAQRAKETGIEEGSYGIVIMPGIGPSGAVKQEVPVQEPEEQEEQEEDDTDEE